MTLIPALHSPVQSLPVVVNGHATPLSVAPNSTTPPSQLHPTNLSPRMAVLSTLVEIITGRQDFSALAGLSFNSSRDLYSALGYPRTLTIRDYRSRYRRGGIAQRLVDIYPLATWSSDARLTEDEKANKDTDFESAVKELFERLDVWSKLTRADILANLGHYSVVVIGDGTALDRPLPKRLSKLLYLQVYAEDNATIETWDDETTSARYGQPDTYRVRTGALDTDMKSRHKARAQTWTTVHHSRILHVADGLVEDNVIGRPRLRAVWNLLDDFDKIVGGGAEAAWKRMDPGLHVDVDKEIALNPAQVEALEGQFDEYQHNLRRILQTQGTKVTPLAAQVAGFGPNASAIVEFICASEGIPQRIFVGSERGELSSTQDRDNWSDRIRERRRGFATPLIRRFVDLLIDRGLLPKPKGVSTDAYARYAHTDSPTGKYLYTITWPRVAQLDSESTGKVLKDLASANMQHAQAGGGLLFIADEIRHRVGLGPQPESAKVPYGKSADAAGETAGKGPANDTATTTE